jgi:hypothetical protein
MLGTQAMPKLCTRKIKNFYRPNRCPVENLPVIPDTYRYKPIKKTAKQLKIIRRLLSEKNIAKIVVAKPQENTCSRRKPTENSGPNLNLKRTKAVDGKR